MHTSLFSHPLLSALFTFGVAEAMTVAADGFPPPRKAVECTPRTGLPNALAKLERGGEVRVAYLGGSITDQAGWRVKSRAWLQQLYPKAKVEEIHAAIGGTNASLGVLRIDHDVFAQRPDLLFVEFAVNDSATDPQEIAMAMEGIVRKTWNTFPECDICFVYTFTDGPMMIDDLRAGKFNRSAAVMEVVADHYGIPSIHLGLEAIRLELAGKLLMKAPEAKVTKVSGDSLNQRSRAAVGADGKIPFSNDGVHPYLDTGHQLYQEAIERSFPSIKAASQRPAPHRPLPAPLTPNLYEASTMLTADRAQLSGPWSKLPADQDTPARWFQNRVDSIWKGEPGAKLTFKFKGTGVTFYDLVGPDGAKLAVTVDGKTVESTRMDGYCTYQRLATLQAAAGLDPQQVHEVSVTVLPEIPDRRDILFPHNRQDMTDHPEKYAGTRWHLGAIFILGNLIN
ncbi:MAG: GDSL-type esterase/lipase family protein [Lentisphaeria bacterium]